jgi:hypothetical protein
LLGDSWPFEELPATQLKGLGSMTTYLAQPM